VVVAHARSAAAGEERATENLAVDDYVMAIYAFENDDNPLTADTCFDLQISH
jgi:predicted lipoprotein with Yx(FWY)xxD motif